MRKFVLFDLSEFPIVVAKYQEIIPSLEEFIQSHIDTESLLAQHSDFAMIIDLTNMPFLPLEYRIAQSKWNAKADKVFVERNVKFVFYTPSSLARLLLNAMLILIKPSIPYTTTSNFKKARELASRMLQSQGEQSGT